MANASLEDCQLFAQSEILQRDLFIAAKQQEDHPKKREDCVQHEAESMSASSLKINRFRNRWNSGEAQLAANRRNARTHLEKLDTKALALRCEKSPEKFSGPRLRQLRSFAAFSLMAQPP